MPTKVTAQSGNCLCGIAVDAGFLNCEPLRALPENKDFLARDLKDGDEVTVPDKEVEDFPKPIDTKHTFKLKSSPPFHIRIVHGSPDLPYRDDSETTTLHVSNFVSNKGGATGLTAFPAGYGYHADGHADPDTFKVEVWDPAAGGSVNVKLEALKPTYTADKGSGKLSVTSYTPFTDAGKKIDALVCNVVSTTTGNTYRSKYMRLVVDDADLAAAAGQMLLVTDIADGLGAGLAADNDTVEILDQMVQATYTIDRCPGTPKCKVTKVVDIGGSERQRVRVHFHSFRKDPGVDTMPTGISANDIEKHLRRRTFKWYRRTFAQADLAPKLESMNVIDPPAENMFCLSHNHGNPVAAVTGSISTFLARASWLTRQIASATTTVATLEFRIKTATRDVPVVIVFTGGETPEQAGAFIAANLPATFKGESLKSSRSTNVTNHSCDVIITADNGERVTLLDIKPSTGLGMTVQVPRVDLMKVLSGDSDYDSSSSFLTIDFKRLLRDVPVTDDAMYCVVVGKFSTPSLRGQAFLPALGYNEPFRPDLPFRSCTIMACDSSDGKVLDDGDNLPYTSPHESTHTLCDLIHTIVGTSHARTELMASGGTSIANSITATKRINDGPYLVQMQRNGQPSTTPNVRMVDVLRTTGAEKMEAW
jgi:hypothetical protein